MNPVRRPRPVWDPLTEPFWASAREDRLAIQRCGDCTAYQHPPNVQCERCGGSSIEFAEVSGYGRVAAWTVMHEPRVAGFEEAVPYACVLVELDEQDDLILAANLIGSAPHEIKAGMRVKAVFESIGADIRLPQFEAVNGSVQGE